MSICLQVISDFFKDHYGKLLESCVIYVGRLTDQGSWIRRGTKEAILSTGSGRESPAPRSGKLYTCAKTNLNLFWQIQCQTRIPYNH